MKKPVLVVMAAGMGSRYGGLKQIDPVDEEGNLIIDFSIYDAVRAGFEKVVFIIKREMEADFRALIGDRVARSIEVEYVYQELDNLPAGFSVPEGRVKPWGTGHALLSCLGRVDAPMAVINADDFYGRHAFSMAYDYLSTHRDSRDRYSYMMVGYLLKNTLTENGHVARGICEVDDENRLRAIRERTQIEQRCGGAAFTEDNGKSWTSLDPDCTVSLNLWGFTPSILAELDARFATFLRQNLQKNPLKCEYFLPSVVDALLKEDRAQVQVEKSVDRWYGVTYKEDKPRLSAAIQKMKDTGIYPQGLQNH